jgi:predicted O-linked N-acetylglucosamine transferase (SPINDLY family)
MFARVFLSLALLLASAVCEDAYTLIEKASALSERGQRQRGLELFLQVARSESLLGQLPKMHQSQLMHNIGFSYQQDGNFPGAIEWLERSAKLVPTEQAHSKAAFCAQAIGSHGLAAAHLDAAIKLAGPKAKPHLYLYHGEMLNNVKRQKEAVKVFTAGLKALGRMIGKNSKAAILNHPAVDVKLLAARLNHAMADALLNLNNATAASKKLETALEFVNAALPSKHGEDDEDGPAGPRGQEEEARHLRLEVMASAAEASRQLVDWRGYEERTKAFLKEVKREIKAVSASRRVGQTEEEEIMGQRRKQAQPHPPPPLSPYSALMLPMDPRLRRELSWQWLERQSNPLSPAHMVDSRDAMQLQHIPEEQDQEKEDAPVAVRLGIISRRFHHYPGTHLMLGLFKRFDRRRIHVTCFATGPDSVAKDANATSPDSMSVERKRLMEECDRFLDLSASGFTALDVAKAVLKEKVHFLVDYDGSHDFNNQRALNAISAVGSSTTPADGSAPVISSWLGFAGPIGYGRGGEEEGEDDDSGHRTRGYSIVDPTIAPLETASFSFNEALLYLPHTYQPQDPDQGDMASGDDAEAEKQAIIAKEGLSTWWKGELPAPDLDLPVPEEGSVEAREGEAKTASDNDSLSSVPAAPSSSPPFVFASFNRLTKLEPSLFAVWSNALRRCGSQCILWLYGGGEDGSEECESGRNFSGFTNAIDEKDPKRFNLWLAAASHGIHPSRVVFACKAPRDYHLKRFSLAADVQLDSLTYGAHTTASDGLYGGVPLVTMPSIAFSSESEDVEGGVASRVGASLLKSLLHVNGTRAPVAAVNSAATHSLAAYENVAVTLPAKAMKKRITEMVLETCAAQHTATCGGRLRTIEGAAAGEDLSLSKPKRAHRRYRYRGLFDSEGFAASLDKASRAVHELRVLQEDLRWSLKNGAGDAVEEGESVDAADGHSSWLPSSIASGKLQHVVLAAAAQTAS